MKSDRRDAQEDGGPAGWIGALYDQYADGLYRYAVMILADPAGAADAVHQVFLGITRRPAGHIQCDERYLKRAVRNECYSILRRSGRERGTDAPLLEAAAADDRPDERLALEAAMRSLPAEQREVVHLKVFAGFTFQEIADQLGESMNTVASRYRYAIEKMRHHLGAEET
jgi:RNA polymerase sigma-70 factor, ECF subfamily